MCRALVMPIDIEGDANLKMRFLAPARFTHPRRRSRQTAGQRGKKRFVALAEMTHTLASRRRLLTIRFIAPAEITHTPWQAALPLFYSASPRWIGLRCRCMKQVACNPQFSSEADHGTMRSPPNPRMASCSVVVTSCPLMGLRLTTRPRGHRRGGPRSLAIMSSCDHLPTTAFNRCH